MRSRALPQGDCCAKQVWAGGKDSDEGICGDRLGVLVRLRPPRALPCRLRADSGRESGPAAHVEGKRRQQHLTAGLDETDIADARQAHALLERGERRLDGGALAREGESGNKSHAEERRLGRVSKRDSISL